MIPQIFWLGIGLNIIVGWLSLTLGMYKLITSSPILNLSSPFKIYHRSDLHFPLVVKNEANHLIHVVFFSNNNYHYYCLTFQIIYIYIYNNCWENKSKITIPKSVPLPWCNGKGKPEINPKDIPLSYYS